MSHQAEISKCRVTAGQNFLSSAFTQHFKVKSVLQSFSSEAGGGLSRPKFSKSNFCCRTRVSADWNSLGPAFTQDLQAKPEHQSPSSVCREGGRGSRQTFCQPNNHSRHYLNSQEHNYLQSPSSIPWGCLKKAKNFQVQPSPEMLHLQQPGTKWPPEPWLYFVGEGRPVHTIVPNVTA